MESYKRFYNNTDKELLAIVEYLKFILLKEKAQGNFNQQKQKHLDELNKIPEIVNTLASIRYDIWAHKPENDKKLQQYRENVHCPQCKIIQKVKIKGERINPDFGWKLDRVKCTVCKKEFINYMPNTFEERKLWNINMIEKLTTIGDDGETNADKMKDEMDMQKTIEVLQGYIDAQTQVEARIKEMILQDEKNKKKIEEFHEYYSDFKIKVDKYYKIEKN